MERTWRVGHIGRDQMYYEELHGGRWQRIEISGEMLMGRTHHVIYFASTAQWARYPEWARSRRKEIIGRIKSEFQPPDYEYHDEAGGAAHTDAAPSSGATVRRPVARRRVQGMSALLLAITLLLALSGGMGWLVFTGVSAGHTTLPMKRATLQRQVTRVEEPALYWVSIGIYTTIGLGALAMGAWGLRERRRLLAG